MPVARCLKCGRFVSLRIGLIYWFDLDEYAWFCDQDCRRRYVHGNETVQYMTPDEQKAYARAMRKAFL